MNIQIDSRKIKPGDTFVAIKGYNTDGHKFINDAIKNGATTIIAEYGNYSVKTILVNDTKHYLETTLKEYYKKITRDLTFIAVTGTNGKTTVAYLVYQIFNSLNVPCAMIGTTGFHLKDKVYETANTTPDAVTIYDLIKKAKDENIKVIVLEASSHSLVQNRILGFDLDIAAFTNLTQDHLDFHKTMDSYLKAKMLILDKLKENAKIIVNVDDKYGKYFCHGKEITIGNKGKDYKFDKIIYEKNYTSIFFKYQGKSYNATTMFNNEFNVYNYINALAIATEFGLNIEDVIGITGKLLLPKGRCETVEYKTNKIVVDYAHTPDAVEKIISSYKKICKGRIITIIGCTGNRDKEKRPLITSIATSLSNIVIFTDDDLHNESRESIKEDMLKGVTNDNYIFINNRKRAIKKGIKLLENNDTLLILGMGHQMFTYIKDKKIPHNDMNEVKKYLNLI